MSATQWQFPEKGSKWFVEGEGGGEVEFVATIEGRALVRDVENGYFYGLTLQFDELKPIHTPEQIAEDRAVEAISGALGVAASDGVDVLEDESCSRVIYRAIRDGKIPGVKLESQ